MSGQKKSIGKLMKYSDSITQASEQTGLSKKRFVNMGKNRYGQSIIVKIPVGSKRRKAKRIQYAFHPTRANKQVRRRSRHAPSGAYSRGKFKGFFHGVK